MSVGLELFGMPVTNGTSVVNGYGSSFAAKHNVPSHFIGGNRLDLAPPGAVKDFVAKSDGHSVITSVRLFIFPALLLLIETSIPREQCLYQN